MKFFSKLLPKTFIGDFASDVLYQKIMLTLPVIIAGNIASIVITSSDAVIVGNVVGTAAYTAISLVSPFQNLLGAITPLASSGFGVLVSLAKGKNDPQGLKRCYRAGWIVTAIVMALVALLSLPLLKTGLSVGDMSVEMEQMALSYGYYICMAGIIGVFSAAGTYVMIALGLTRYMVGLSLVESIVNVAADLVFVCLLDMGIAGAGLGTLVANCVRGGMTLWILRKQGAFDIRGVSCTWDEIKEVPLNGIPLAVSILMISLQGYYINYAVLKYFGEAALGAKAVGLFGRSLAMMLGRSCIQVIAPLLGLFAAVASYKAFRHVLRFTLKLCVAVELPIIFMCLFMPQVLFYINGYGEVTDLELNVVRTISLSILFVCANVILNNAFVYLGEKGKSVAMSTIENAFLLPGGVILFSCINAEWIFWGYALAAGTCMLVSLILYRDIYRKKSEQEKGYEFVVSYSDFNDAVEASEHLQKNCEGHRLGKMLAYKIALCMEEISLYLSEQEKEEDFDIQFIVKIQESAAKFIVIDKSVNDNKFNEGSDLSEFITESAEMLKKLCRNISQRYVYGLNVYIMEIVE